MGRVITTFDGLLADLDQFGRLPSVATVERNFNAQLARLPGDGGGFLVVTRQENCLGVRRFYRGQLCVEVRIAAAEFLFGNNLPTALEIARLKKISEADAVGLGDVSHDGDFFRV